MPVGKEVLILQYLFINLFLCTTVRMQNYYMYGLGYCNLIGVMYVFVKD